MIKATGIRKQISTGFMFHPYGLPLLAVVHFFCRYIQQQNTLNEPEFIEGESKSACLADRGFHLFLPVGLSFIPVIKVKI